jgi:penicillin-binding protein 1A
MKRSNTRKPAPAKKSGGSTQKKAGKKTVKKAVKKKSSPKLVLSLWAIVAFLIFFFYMVHDLPSTHEMLEEQGAGSIRILATDGSLLKQIGTPYGEAIPFSDIPKDMVNAAVSIEDRRFFDHWGIDPRGLARAIFVNITQGSMRQGGSTITQQLAKIAFLSPEKTFRRKFQEAFMALKIEHNFTKSQIMAHYLNRAYFGGGAYGVEAASRVYFNKPASRLRLNECAMLAGLLKAPSKFSPFNDPKLAASRATIVLKAMAEEGYIKPDKATNLKPENFGISDATYNTVNSSPYFTDWVSSLIPEYVLPGGKALTIVTTLNPQKQRLAEAALASVLNASGEKKDADQAALVSLDTDGAVLAMVGGRKYGESQFNRVTQAFRQPGSTFKLFVYLAALENGWKVDQRITDEPITVEGWSPKNFSERYIGDTTLREAFADSINTVAVKLSEKVGRNKIISMARRLGVDSDLQPIPSVALGTSEMTLLELTQSYNVLANSGKEALAYAIKEVRTRDGKVLYKRGDFKPARLITMPVVRQANSLLIGAGLKGTARAAYFGHPLAIKTGTSQDYRDAWIVGYTGHMTTGVWIGNDDGSPMKSVTGGSLPAQIFSRYMRPAHEGLKGIYLPSTENDNIIHEVTPETEEPSLWDRLFNGF